MINSLFYLLVTAYLALPVQQEATPPTPSVADAAKAARERKSSSKLKHVLTDDDVARRGGSPSAATGEITEAQVRAQLEVDPTVPKAPTAADLEHRIYDFSVASGNSPDIEADNLKRGPMYAYRNPDFPGKKEWEEQMDIAARHFVEEAGPAASRLRAILKENEQAFSLHDPAVSQKVRAEWIEALIPYTTWQMRVRQLWLEGEARAKASAAKAQPR
jgi:hypothetical protein